MWRSIQITSMYIMCRLSGPKQSCQKSPNCENNIPMEEKYICARFKQMQRLGCTQFKAEVFNLLRHWWGRVQTSALDYVHPSRCICLNRAHLYFLCMAISHTDWLKNFIFDTHGLYDSIIFAPFVVENNLLVCRVNMCEKNFWKCSFLPSFIGPFKKSKGHHFGYRNILFFLQVGSMCVFIMRLGPLFKKRKNWF